MPAPPAVAPVPAEGAGGIPNNPAAWTPPVRSNTGCAARSRPGSPSSHSIGATVSSAGQPGAARRTSSIEVVPQIPHALVVTTCRCARSGGNATPAASVASMTLKVCSPASLVPAQ